MNRTLAASLIIFLFSVSILAYFICDLNQEPPTETKPVVGDLTYANPQKLGTNVWGIFLAPSDVGPGGSLLVWNGSVWNEDLYYHQYLNLPGADSAFYRPYSFSSNAYEIAVASEQWSRIRAESLFSKKLEYQPLGIITVIQLDYPNGPFVYLEMEGKDKRRVLRLPTPQDEAMDIESWLRDASISASDGAVLMSLKFEIYKSGSGTPSETLSVDYRLKGGLWEMLSAIP